MILRTWRGSTSIEDAERYLEFLRRGPVLEMEAAPGNRGVWVSQREGVNVVEFLVLSLWTSEQAVTAFAGDDPKRAVILPEAEAMLVERDETVDHFVLAAVGGGTGAAMIAESRRLIGDDYLPKIRRALERLPAGDVWWRPNEASNSVGNLLLHMAGNIRQWIVSGVGGEPDRRRRQEEFDAADAGAKDALMAALESAVADADAVLAGLDPARLGDGIRIQGHETTVMRAVYHAVEHFSMHAGQILWIAKSRAGQGLGLYETGPDGHPRAAWRRPGLVAPSGRATLAESTDKELERLRYPIGRFRPKDALSPEERLALIDEIEALPSAMREAVSPLSPAALDSSYRPGGWTLRQVVHHVPDSHLNAYIRFKLALTEDEPTIKTFEEAAWAELPDATTGDVGPSLAVLDGLHARWVRLLRSMDTADFQRAVAHPDAGRITMDRLLQLYAWHGRHHLGHLAAGRAGRVGSASSPAAG